MLHMFQLISHQQCELMLFLVMKQAPSMTLHLHFLGGLKESEYFNPVNHPSTKMPVWTGFFFLLF